jgi:hypothetical protein
MDSSITSIAEDARRAAQRYIETGVEQEPNLLTDSEQIGTWRAVFARCVHEMRAEPGTGGAA